MYLVPESIFCGWCTYGSVDGNMIKLPALGFIRTPWFGKLGAMSFRDETEKEIHKYTYLNAKVGHDFLIDEHWGISVDAGIFYELSNQEIKKTSSNSWFKLDFDFHILPAIGVQVFYTL